MFHLGFLLVYFFFAVARFCVHLRSFRRGPHRNSRVGTLSEEVRVAWGLPLNSSGMDTEALGPQSSPSPRGAGWKGEVSPSLTALWQRGNDGSPHQAPTRCLGVGMSMVTKKPVLGLL